MNSLQTAPLGRTGVPVTRLGFGSNELQQAPSRPALDHKEASRLLNAVIDVGINYIDTSPDYGPAEDLIGRSLEGRRAEYVLASKCGCIPESDWSVPHLYTRDNVRAGVESSLRRMRTDYLDVVQFHFSPSRAVIEADDALAELDELREAGKVRYLGMSGTLPHIWDHIDMGVFDVFQIPYSGVEREHERVMTAAARAGAGIVVRGGVGRGVSVGDRAVAETTSTPDRRAKFDGLRAADIWTVDMSQREERLRQAALDDLLGGMGLMEFMLRFTLSHPHADTVIVGTRNIDHLRDNVRIANLGPLPADLYEEAKRRLPGGAAARTS
jgi:aryl-alcohol dehydrogenase-like predicted oxidoreductase